MCRAAGWGRTGVAKPGSDTLREVKLRIMDEKTCESYWTYNYKLQLCVGNPRKTRSAYKVLHTYTSSPFRDAASFRGNRAQKLPRTVNGVCVHEFLALWELEISL
jgi:hypothetical protein